MVFAAFASLLQEVWFFGFIPICTLLKPWNIFWLKYLVDEKQDLRVSYILGYFAKCVKDYFYLLPALVTTLVLGFYDPVKMKNILKSILLKRQELKNAVSDANKK